MKYYVKIIYIKQNCEKSEYFVYSTVYFFFCSKVKDRTIFNKFYYDVKEIRMSNVYIVLLKETMNVFSRKIISCDNKSLRLCFFLLRNVCEGWSNRRRGCI